LLQLPDDKLPKAEDLPGQLKKVAGVIGVRATLQLAVAFPGLYIYLHQVGPVWRPVRDAIIVERYRALCNEAAVNPVAQLALEAELSEPYVRRILGRPQVTQGKLF